jgi:hypothetical protein
MRRGWRSPIRSVMPGLDPGPRPLSTCGRGRPRSTYPQRHADEGRHPRQAKAAAFGLSEIPAFAGMTAKLAPAGPRATSPDAEGDPGPRSLSTCGRGRPRSNGRSRRRPSPHSVMPTKATSAPCIHGRQTLASCGLSRIPACRRNDGQVGAKLDRARPRALVSCGRGRPRSIFPQRHADEGRHPRQAKACVLRPIGDSGLRRNDGQVGAKLAPGSLRVRGCGRVVSSTFPGRAQRGPGIQPCSAAAGPDRFASGDVERVRAGPRIAFGVRGGGARSPYATSRTILPTCALVSMRAWALAASARG